MAHENILGYTMQFWIGMRKKISLIITKLNENKKKKYISFIHREKKNTSPPSRTNNMKWPSISCEKFSRWWNDKLYYKSFELREIIALVTVSF